MAQVSRAQIVAFYLFDVAESADLRLVPSLIGGGTVPARLAPKPATPSYVQYDKPPLSFDGEAVGMAEISGFRTRVRVYDYGVVSVGLTQSFSGTWQELIGRSQQLLDNADLERQAERLCRLVLDRLRPALPGAREQFLSEDYLVFAVNELEVPMSADALLEQHGDEIAALLRGERQVLSAQERGSIMPSACSGLSRVVSGSIGEKPMSNRS